MSREGSTGWSVKVTHPTSGRTIRPDVLEEPQYVPGPNGLPEIRVPVRRAASWLSQDFDDSPSMSVYLDGNELPIDELVDVEDSQGRTVLIGEGGIELRQRVQTEYRTEERDVAARNLIQNETSYDDDVDTASFPTVTDETLQNPSTTTEFNDVSDIPNSLPLTTQNDEFEMLQSAEFNKGTSTTDQNASSETVAGAESGSVYRITNVGEYVEYSIAFDYDPPDGEGLLHLREAADNTNDGGTKGYIPGVVITLNGTTILDRSPTNTTNVTDGFQITQVSDIDIDSGTNTLRIEVDEVSAKDIVATFEDGNGDPVTGESFELVDNNTDNTVEIATTDSNGVAVYPNISSGTYYFEGGLLAATDTFDHNDNETTSVTVKTDGSGTVTVDSRVSEEFHGLDVDCLWLYDDRYSYGSDNSTDNNDTLSAPELYPDQLTFSFEDAPSAFNIYAGDASLTIDDTSGPQRLQISNDSGQTWLPSNGDEDNTDSVSVDFPDPGATLRQRVTLSRISPNGERSQTPRFGYDTQTISDYELTADISQESLLVDESYDEELVSILNDIAGEQFLWRYHIKNGSPTISWTQPGQRTASSDPQVSDQQITKRVETWEKVVIKGSALNVSDEQFTASTSFQDLDESNIVTGSEVVFDSSSGARFDRGADYEMDYGDGKIKRIAAGDLTDGNTYSIDYRYEIVGSHEISGAPADPKELVETIPGVVSSRQAEQIAYVLAEIEPELKTPRYEGDIVVPRLDASFDPLEALQLSEFDLPGAATPLSIRGKPELTPGQISIRLGSAPPLDASLGSISERVRSVSKRV